MPLRARLGNAGVFLPIVFVGSGHDDRAGNEVLVVSDQYAAFACIDHLIGLEREAADLANGPDLSVMPQGTQRMSGVFDHRNAGGIAQGHDSIHVRRVTAHMADDNCVHRRKLC